MSGSFSNKRRHTLWSARDGAGFAELIRTELGVGLDALVAKFAAPDAVLLAVLGGSIPLAMANPVSDIDLLFVVEGEEALTASAAPSRARVDFRAGADALILGESTAVINEIEIDVQFVRRAHLHALLGRVVAGRAAFAQEELVILSRLAGGWVLTGDPERVSERWSSTWREALRMYCMTRDYVFALKMFEDAAEEAAERPALSRHLGRLAAEYACRAFLSSHGCTALGSKWMLLMDEGHAFAARHLRGTVFAASARLLFPDAACDAATYLRDVGEFLAEARREIAKQPMMGIALQVCPQVYPVAQAQETPR